MKKYIKPEMNFELFEIEDVITTSGEGDDSSSGRQLTTMVNEKEGTNYGSEVVSVFE